MPEVLFRPSYSSAAWVFEGQPYAVQVEAAVEVPIIEVVYLYETLLLHESGSPILAPDGSPVLDENDSPMMYESREEIQVIVGQEDVVVGYEPGTALIDSWADGSPWPGAYRDILRLYGWHVVAVSLASGWMTGGLGSRWRTDDLESSWQAATRRASWEAHEMTDSWQVGALSDGGTP